MRDKKWVFTQKQRNPRVAGKTVGGWCRSSLFFSLSLLIFWSTPGGASSTPRGSNGNLRVGFVQCVCE